MEHEQPDLRGDRDTHTDVSAEVFLTSKTLTLGANIRPGGVAVLMMFERETHIESSKLEPKRHTKCIVWGPVLFFNIRK